MLKSNGLEREPSGTSAKTLFHWLKELFILQNWYMFTEKLILSKISDNNQ